MPSVIQQDRISDSGVAEQLQQVPVQREGDGPTSESAKHEPTCVRCERTGTVLRPDHDVPGAFSCDVMSGDWDECRKLFKPNCPPWCRGKHFQGDERDAIRDRTWFHCSEGISLVTHSSDRVSSPETIHVDICACEDIGEEIKDIDVFLNGTIMTPTQAKHLALILNTTAVLAATKSTR
jgi:hypothetical protein